MPNVSVRRRGTGGRGGQSSCNEEIHVCRGRGQVYWEEVLVSDRRTPILDVGREMTGARVGGGFRGEGYV